MSPRILRLFKRAFGLGRHPRAMLQPQRSLYKSLKRRYRTGSPTQRATMVANARALLTTPSTT